MALIRYIAVAGDYLVKIAEVHGTTWQAIWYHPHNAAHRASRGSPDFLYAGDVLYIESPSPSPPGPADVPVPSKPARPASPPPEPPEHPPWPTHVTTAREEGPRWLCPTGQCSCEASHSQTEPVAFAVLLHDRDGERMPGALARVSLPGTDEPLLLTADGSGWLVVPCMATRHLTAVLLTWLDPADAQPAVYVLRYHVDLGSELATQVRHRIANLGFGAGRSLTESVADFERFYGMPVTGDPHAIALTAQLYHDAGALPVGQATDGIPPPPSPPPPPPTFPAGHTPIGGGDGSGRGAARVRPRLHRLRLLDHFHEAAAGAPWTLQAAGLEWSGTSDAAGGLEVELPADVRRGRVRWTPPGEPPTGRDVHLDTHDLGSTATVARLQNLGFVQCSEHIESYRLVKDRPHEAVPQPMVEEEVRHWHDGGPAPDATTVLHAAGEVSSPPKTTTCPKARVDLFRDKLGFAPVKQVKAHTAHHTAQKIELWQTNVWLGQHSAITIHDLPKTKYELYSHNLYWKTMSQLTDTVKGKVDYIWLGACGAGSDNNLMSFVAEKTGAWVIANGHACSNHGRLPMRRYDWEVPAMPKVWKWDRQNGEPWPIGQWELFYEARERADSKDFHAGLSFNVVEVR